MPGNRHEKIEIIKKNTRKMDILNSMIQDVQSGDRKKLLLVIIKLSAAFTVAFLICSFVGKIIYHMINYLLLIIDYYGLD